MDDHERAARRKAFVTQHFADYVADLRRRWTKALESGRVEYAHYDERMAEIDWAVIKVQDAIASRDEAYWLANRQFDPHWWIGRYIAVLAADRRIAKRRYPQKRR